MTSEEIQDKGIVRTFQNGIATVELERGGGCSGCAMRGFCFSKSSPAVFHLATDLNLEPGDEVELAISAEGKILASFLIFVLPILFLIIGFLIANLYFTELVSIIFAFGAMALSFLVVRYCDRKLGHKFKVEIVRKL